jgi:hypothetical protein
MFSIGTIIKEVDGLVTVTIREKETNSEGEDPRPKLVNLPYYPLKSVMGVLGRTR